MFSCQKTHHQNMVRPTEFESATFGSGVQCSIRLSYGRKILKHIVNFKLKKFLNQ